MEKSAFLFKYLSILIMLIVPLRNIVEKVPNFGLDGLNITNILFTIAILSVIFNKERIYGNEHQNKIGIGIFIYLIYFLLTVFLTDQSIVALGEMLKFWKDLALCMSLYFIAYAAFKTKAEIKICIGVMALSNIYMAVYFWRWVRWTDFANYMDKLKYVNGTFGSVGGSNEWAAFFSTYSFIALAILESKEKKWVRICAGGILLGNILVMLFTFSRGAYVAFTVGLVVYSLISKNYKWIAIVGLIVLFYGVVLPDSVVERIDMSYSKTEDGSLRDPDVISRLEMWEFSIENILKSPLIGNGFMSFVFSEWRNPHNQHLNVLYQGGLIGYFLFLMLFYKSFQNSWRAIMRNRKTSFELALPLGLLAGTISLIIANFFGDRFSYLPLTGYFWALNGLVNNLNNE